MAGRLISATIISVDSNEIDLADVVDAENNDNDRSTRDNENQIQFFAENKSKSIQEDGSGKTIDSGTKEEVSSSHRTCKIEKINFKSEYTLGPLDIYLSSTEKLTYSCVTSRIALYDSPGQRSEICMGKSRVQDSKNVTEMEEGESGNVNGRLSPLANEIALAGRLHAKNVMARDVNAGYAAILKNVLQFPSESALPHSALDIPEAATKEWQWKLFTDPFESKLESPHQNSKKKMWFFK